MTSDWLIIILVFTYSSFDTNTSGQRLKSTKVQSDSKSDLVDSSDIKDLKDLINELLEVELDKSSQSSDWGSSEDLSDKQIDYAANDVRYLIEAMHKLKVILDREGRYELAQKCFKTIPVHSELDILKFSNIFEH
mgnify:CR=1 FL=1